MPFFAEVILPLSLSKTFTYRISEAEFHFIKNGMRVSVPFGKSKIYTALVIALHQNEPTLYEAKEIHQILDEFPVVNEIQIAHWQWIASYYMCAIGDVYRGAMPSALLLESETLISQTNNVFIDASQLSDEEFLVYQALQQQSSLKVKDIMAILNKKNVFPILQKLMDKKILVVEEEVQETYTPKLIRYVRLNSKWEAPDTLNILLESLKNASKQRELVLHYFQIQASDKKPLAVKKLLEVATSSASVLKGLIEKDVFEEFHLQEDRVSYKGAVKEQKPKLSLVQEQAFQEIEVSFETKEVTL